MLFPARLWAVCSLKHVFMFLVKGEILFTLEILCQTQMGFAEKDAGLKLPCETLAVRSGSPREAGQNQERGHTDTDASSRTTLTRASVGSFTATMFVAMCL